MLKPLLVLLCIMLLVFSGQVLSATDDIERLQSTPVLYNMDTPLLQTVFTHGQALGNRADVFTKVGDSNTTNGDFLLAIGMGKTFCHLGSYAYLQETIDFFSATPPREDVQNSFNSYSIAAQKGLSSASVLDPFWATNALCEANESPLMCEYRIVKPSISIIMLGLMDSRYGEPESFAHYMEEIVKQSIEAGVIPVLTTFVVLPDQEVLNYDHSIQMNIALVDIAETYGTPLINLWAAVQELPNYGIGPDRTHLAHSVGQYCDFTGAEQEYGGTLRNLLTLQALDQLRKNVLIP
ncbi:MAG: hypothetical protein K8I82_00455 [Anaerolineae bacterium]|nr:hypothetical protein [Anaerolineae bacterium]